MKWNTFLFNDYLMGETRILGEGKTTKKLNKIGDKK
jgi:hypothetical protein